MNRSSIVIDEELARTVFPGQDPIGKQIRVGLFDFDPKTRGDVRRPIEIDSAVCRKCDRRHRSVRNSDACTDELDSKGACFLRQHTCRCE
jgi:hypothetical protein